jgi:RNA polymerase sigma-70 factor (ECF subfamily)
VPLDVADLYRKHGGMVFRRARVILGDDERARDIVQDVFLLLHRQRGVLRSGGLVSWLYTTTTHRCFNALRNHGTRSRLLGEARASMTTEQQDRSEPLVLLRGLLPDLDEELALLAVYRFVDEMTHAEIAAQLGCSRRHVGDLLVRLEERLAVVRAAELCRRTCLSKPRNARHQVHVQRVSGQKFKLLSIELC